MKNGSRAVAGLALGVGVVVLGAIGYALLWTTYMVYDDEGYVLYSLKAYAQHGHLYTDVYSQYGPFFFTLCSAAHRLGIAFTNIGAREATLVCWLGAAVLCALVVWRVTRGNAAAVVATLTGVFLHLHIMSSEPSHPGGFIALAVAAAAWCATSEQRPSWAPAAVVGALGAMLVLTKINVGLLLLIGAGAWWVWRAWDRPLSRSVLALGLMVTPVGLMWGLRAEPWVRTFMAVAAAGGVAVVLALPRSRATPGSGSRVTWRDALAALGGFAVIAAATVATMVRHGTTPAALLEGTLLGPLRHAFVYHLSLYWRPGTLLLAAASLVLASVAARATPARRKRLVVIARLGFVVPYAAALGGWLQIASAAYVLCYGVAAAWVYVMPCHEDDETSGVRALLALLLVTQCLHAYPVAGSQLSWGTFLWVPLVVLGLYDLAPAISATVVRRAAAIATFGFVAIVGARAAIVAADRWHSSDRLGLPGAETLALPEDFTTTVRTLVRNTQTHGDVLFTLPGMMSFNAWTGVPPPTTANATHWFNLLSDEQQLAIKARLEASPRSVVIVQTYVYDFLDAQHFLHDGALLNWVREQYTPAFRIGTYEFRVRKGRTIAPVDVATLFTNSGDAGAKFRLHVAAVLPGDAKISAIELRRLQDDRSTPVVRWGNGNAAFIATPLRAADPSQPAAAANRSRVPFAASPVMAIDVFTNEFPADLDRNQAIIYLLDDGGNRLGEARFVN